MACCAWQYPSRGRPVAAQPASTPSQPVAREPPGAAANGGSARCHRASGLLAQEGSRCPRGPAPDVLRLVQRDDAVRQAAGGRATETGLAGDAGDWHASSLLTIGRDCGAACEPREILGRQRAIPEPDSIVDSVGLPFSVAARW